MPQMSPMLWSLLFIYFIILFMFFNVMNYFNFIPSLKTSLIQQQNNFTPKISLTWKW